MKMKVTPVSLSSSDVYSQEGLPEGDLLADTHSDMESPAEDFSEYMWMENEEEFDKMVIKQLEEEALMEECYQAMMEDEKEEALGLEMMTQFDKLKVTDRAELVRKSTLNPNAAEFVPGAST